MKIMIELQVRKFFQYRDTIFLCTTGENCRLINNNIPLLENIPNNF